MNLQLLDKTRESTELIGWLWRSYMKRHTPKIIAAFLFMAIQGGSLGLLSYTIQFVFDDVAGPGPIKAGFSMSEVLFSCCLQSGDSPVSSSVSS